MPFSGANGAITTDATVVRSGSYAYKVTKASGTDSYVRTGGMTTQVLVARFAVRFASLPGASVRIVDTNGSGTLPTVGYDQPSGKFKVIIGANSQLSASTISAGTWYRLDLRFDHSSTTRRVDWQLDGSPQTQVSKTGESATSITQVYLGSDVSADVYTAYFDDLTLTATSGDYPLGDGRVQALRPDGVTAVNDPAGSTVKDDTSANVTVATPGAASRLDDNPMTATNDYIKHIGTNAASYAELSFADTARNACVNAVQATVAQRGSNATGGIGATYVYDGATQRTVAASATISGTTLAYKSAVISPATGSWTATKLNGLVARVGYSSNATATNYPRWEGLLLEYDTTPNPPVTYESTVLADGPAGYWRLGETSGTTATATSGSPNGTYTNAPTLGVSSLVGDTDSSVGFDGSNDIVDFGDNYRFAANATFSIEIWLKPTAATSNERTVVTKEDGGGQGWALVLNATTNTVAIERGNGGSWDMANSTTGLQAGTWYHIVGTYDGTNLRTYVNGTLETTLASSRSLPTITSPLQLSSTNANFQYSGFMDEFTIYTSALALARIQAHYNAGKP
jgi:Concanavalin A-like lectin/glucanases superfamily